MSKRALIASIVGLTAVAIVTFLLWYQAHYSMGVVEPFTVGDSTAPNRVLIATQGSEFKNAVVQGIVKSLRNQAVLVKVIDVTGLLAIDAGEWDAIVVLHTWEKWEPPVAVSTFVARWRSIDNAVFLSTSGAGDQKIEGVDAIATASQMVDVSTHIAALIQRISLLLNKK